MRDGWSARSNRVPRWTPHVPRMRESMHAFQQGRR